MSKPTVEYEIKLTGAALAELFRTGAVHKIDDGLPDSDQAPQLMDAIVDPQGNLRLVFLCTDDIDGMPDGLAAPLTVSKPITVRTLEELA